MRGFFKELEEDFMAPLDPESRAQLHELLVRLAVHNDPSCAFRPAAASAPVETA